MIPSSLHRNGPARARRALGALAVALLLTSLSESAAQGQDWKVLVGTSPTPPSKGLLRLPLRPNVTQSYYVFVQRLDSAKKEDKEVLVRIRTDGKAAQLLAEVKVAVPEGGPVFVRLGPEPKPAEDGKPAPPKPPAFKPPATPPFNLIVEVLRPGAKEEKPLASLAVPVDVASPSEYVTVTRARYQTGATPGENRLRLQVQASEGFAGPPCPVELVLLPELIPGLSTGKKSGFLRQNLNRAGDVTELFAENLIFQGTPPERGEVALTVDGYARRLLYAVNFTRTDAEQTPGRVESAEPVVRLLDDRRAYLPVEKVGLRLEVEDESSRVAKLQIGVDRNRDDVYQPSELMERPGNRERLVSIAPAGPDGGLVFKSEVRDWLLEIDTAGFYGRLPYRVRLLDNQEQPIRVRPTRDGPPSDELFGYLIFDDSPPELVKFADAKAFPRELERGQKLRVEATGSDPESAVDRVAFFVGKPVANKEGKLEAPPGTEPVKGERAKGDWWAANLPVPDRAGVFLLTTQFVNGAGQSTFETIEIRLVEPGAGGAAAAKKFKVSGTVVEGSAPQPGLEVLLKDEKGAVKGVAKTSKDPKTVGAFTFENVAPGAYTVSSAKVGSNTKGEANVAVEASDVTGVEVKLFR